MPVKLICPQCGASMTVPAPIPLKCPRCKVPMTPQQSEDTQPTDNSQPDIAPVNAAMPQQEDELTAVFRKAREQADAILAQAKAEAEATLKQAEASAKEMTLKAEGILADAQQKQEECRQDTNDPKADVLTDDGTQTPDDVSGGNGPLLGYAIICILSVITAYLSQQAKPAMFLAAATAAVALFGALVPLCRHR